MNWGRSAAQQQWFDDAERAEKERAAAKRELRADERRTSIEQLRAEMQREIAALRGEMAEQKALIFDAVGQVLGEISNKICDRVEGTVNKLESDLRRQFGEAMGRIDALAPDARSRSKRYEFANERDEEKGIIDLPNPLTRTDVEGASALHFNAGTAAAPAARCRKFRRDRFMGFSPPAGAR